MSHIVCSAEKIILAATATIEKILREREYANTCMLNKAMKKVHFFSRKPYTKEDAIKWLDNSYYMFGWRSVYAYGDLYHANRLLTLAKHGDPVTVDAESAYILWG